MARPRKFDEDEVLRVARDRFWTTGYAATSLDDVLKDTGLGKGSLYAAFGDKHALFLRAFDGYCAGLVEGIGGRLDGPDEDALDRLHALVTAVAEATAADTCFRGCLLANGTAELSGRDPEVRAAAHRTYTALREQLAEAVAAAQRAGAIDPAAAPDRLALLLLAVLRGIEALGKGAVGGDALRSIAETALSLLPRP
ncbi:TetR/AcrR family transcriptional regulator [Streptomyces sp. NPDC026672]|uniref:TetR/AcrR family transcriptional regulator n=1 Tax=unclassified Streptomyces TaxID=2593676 RepID=UPI0033C91FF7